MATGIQEVSLHIDGKIFNVKKDLLCEHSDYFRAMFSGNYIEHQKQDISIDVVDADSMELIVNYMNLGLIDLSEYTLKVVGNLATAANFLQITELIKQIQYCLDLQLGPPNWVEIMTIAENAAYNELEQLAGTCGLLSFKDMEPDYIPTFKKLFWYLSHPFLNAETEADVFKFGLKWVMHPDTCCCGDILLLILACLDVKRLTIEDIKDISIFVKNFENHKVPKVVDCLKMLLENKLQVNLSVLVGYKKELCETFNESIYNEVYNIINESPTRSLKLTPVVPIRTLNNKRLDASPHFMYSFSTSTGLQKWLEVAEKSLWGWSSTSWGLNKLVVVGGEYGSGSGRYMKDIRVYDTLRKQWTHHGVNLPRFRHAGVTVCRDSLFIVGGIGAYRVIQETTIVYDLIQRAYRRVANFPDALQSPGICTHYNTVYAAGCKDVYKYEYLGEVDQWVKVMSTDVRLQHLVSFGDYIYCTQNYFEEMYRFRPGIDTRLQIVTKFTAPPMAFANIGNRLTVFTTFMTGQQPDQFLVEEYKGPCTCKIEPHSEGIHICGPEVVMRNMTPNLKINDVAGACALVMDIPRLHYETSDYHKNIISQYGHITYNMK